MVGECLVLFFILKNKEQYPETWHYYVYENYFLPAGKFSATVNPPFFYFNRRNITR